MKQNEVDKTIERLINRENSKYFIRRTKIGPVSYNEVNGKLYTVKERFDLDKTEEGRLEEEDTSVFNSSEIEEIMKIHSFNKGSGWSISEQQYNETCERNFHEQISNFFEKGLYAVETSIERTATSLEGSYNRKLSIEEQREKAKDLLGTEGFGFNTRKGDATLGAFSNRDELNALLILEIPESCFGNVEQISKLFEKTKDTLITETAYRDIKEIDTVIPREYIKGAFFTQGKDILYSDNAHCTPDKKVEYGIYDRQTVREMLEGLNRQEHINSEEVLKLLTIIKNDFSCGNDSAELNDRISKIEELLTKVDNKSAIEDLKITIENITDSLKNPLEKELNKISKLDFSKLSADEVANNIQSFVLTGSDILRQTNANENSTSYDFNEMLKDYEKGLKILSENALKELYYDYRANNAHAMINVKLTDINKLHGLEEESSDLFDSELLGELQECDREKYEDYLKQIDDAKNKVCEDSITDLDKNAFLGEKDTSDTGGASTFDECIKHIEQSHIIKPTNLDSETSTENSELDEIFQK